MPIFDLSFVAEGHEITVGVIADSEEKAKEAFRVRHPLAEITRVVLVEADDPVVRL